MFHFTTAADPRPDRSDAANNTAPVMLEPAVDDAPMVTLPALGRIARVAVEAASRFARADVSAMTMAWMEAPRPLFGGLNAIEACTEPHHCRRAMTLHGLEMDPDSDAEDVDGVMAPVDPFEEFGTMPAGVGSGDVGRAGAVEEALERPSSAIEVGGSGRPPIRIPADDGARLDTVAESPLPSAVDDPWIAGDQRFARTFVTETLFETMSMMARATSYRVTHGVAARGSRLVCA